MNELKPEDVMRALEVMSASGIYASPNFQRNILTLLREKDAEIERLRNSITFKVAMPDEKMEEIKAECLKRVELDIKAAKDKFAEETIEWCRKKLKFDKYRTIGLSGKQLKGYEDAMKAVMSYMHSLKSKDDFPNCKISGCEAARKDCHIGCPHGKENSNDSGTKV